MASSASPFKLLPLYAHHLLWCTVVGLALLSLARADLELEMRACHNAVVPTTCLRCLDSNPELVKADLVGIVRIIIGCLDAHADSLVRNATDMAKFRRKDVQQALDQCKQGFLKLRKHLSDAKQQLDSYGYDKAGRSIWTAIGYTQDCQSHLKNLSYEAPDEFYFEMRVYEELSDAAVKIIERL